MNGTQGPILSVKDVVAVVRNQMEDRVLRSKLEFIQLEERQVLRRFRSQTRLLRLRQEQRLGNVARRTNEIPGTLNTNKGLPSFEGISREPSKTGTYNDRRTSKVTNGYDEGLSSENKLLSNDTETSQHKKRLPRLSTTDDEKTRRLLTPTLKGTCQLPANHNDRLSPASAAAGRGATESRDQSRSPQVNNESKDCVTSESETVTSFLTDLPLEKAVRRQRSQTWNGTALPRMPRSPISSAVGRERSFSDDDEVQMNKKFSFCSLSKNAFDETLNIDKRTQKRTSRWAPILNALQSHKTNQDVSLKQTLPAENLNRGGTKLISGNIPAQRWMSTDSLECSLETRLPPVLEEDHFKPACEKKEDDDSICQLPINAPTCNVRPRLRSLRGKESVVEDLECENARKRSTASSRVRVGAIGGLRKPSRASLKQQSGEEQAQASGYEESVVEKGVLEKQGLITRPRTWALNRPQLDWCPIEEDSKPTKSTDVVKEQVSLSKAKRASTKTLKTEDQDIPEAIDQSKWINTIKKLFTVNMFLTGMVSLQKQRVKELEATEKKNAALEKLYEELQHCRYLRLPSREDEEDTDSVSWVFSKD